MNKTIGDRFKDRRRELNLSIEKVSDELKIRPEFLKALEEDNYSVFTSDIYAKGFIKSYSKYLGLDSQSFSAVYRRDIETSKLPTKKNRDAKNIGDDKKTIFISREKFKYIFAIAFSALILFGVLSILNKAFEPPFLELISPFTLNSNSSTTTDYYDKTIRLTGKTNPNIVIKINGIVVPANTDNTFESDLYPITQDINKFFVEAISNVGVISRIELTLNKKTNIIEDASSIIGALQIVKDNSFIKIYLDDREAIKGVYFENDSIPLIAKNKISFEADKPENIKIFLNGEEYKIVGQILKLSFVDNKLVEDD